MQKYIESVLKGVGQVMLQENSWTGLLFLVVWLLNGVERLVRTRS